MVRTGYPCGRFSSAFIPLQYFSSWSLTGAITLWLMSRTEAPVWQRGLAIPAGVQGICRCYLNVGTLWHPCSGQWLSLLGFSYGFKKQSLEKLFVTVGKNPKKADHKSGHRMNSERTNKIRASNKFHFGQSRNIFLVESSG